jgi:hypothetical protein
MTRQNRNKNTLYVIAFFCLVAFLSSEFSQWGMTGIFFALLISIGLLVGCMFLFKAIGRKTNEMLDGKPNQVEHLLAPGGYRRARYKESWDEYAKQSVVVPTPNRPLQRGDIVPEASSRTVAPVISSRAMVPVQPTQVKRQDLRTARHLNGWLELAHDFNPSHDQMIGRALTGFGMRGSGKSELLALLLEQIWKIPVIPGVCFDYKVDFASLHEILPNVRIGGAPEWEDAELYQKKYWAITVENAKHVGYEVRERGAQLVVELSSYSTMDEQAQVMSGIIAGMFAWAKDNRAHLVPAIVALDEAQQYLPQNQQDSPIADKKLLAELFRAFKQLNEIGRSYGLQPLIFTQRAARVNKDVIGGTEIYVLMKQTTPQDLAACDDILGEKVDRALISGFKPGDALVFEGGQHFTVHFEHRQSTHLNRTPTVKDAEKLYRNRQVPEQFTITLPEEDFSPLDAAYPSDDYDPLNEDEDEIETEGLQAEQPTRTPVAVKAKAKTDLEIVVEYFKENPHISFRAAAPILKIGGKDKLGELYREAKERGLLG